ncbi:hypothetical protein ABIB07_003476 [Bradyrhizobium sp. RT10b]
MTKLCTFCGQPFDAGPAIKFCCDDHRKRHAKELTRLRVAEWRALHPDKARVHNADAATRYHNKPERQKARQVRAQQRAAEHAERRERKERAQALQATLRECWICGALFASRHPAKLTCSPAHQKERHKLVTEEAERRWKEANPEKMRAYQTACMVRRRTALRRVVRIVPEMFPAGTKHNKKLRVAYRIAKTFDLVEQRR